MLKEVEKNAFGEKSGLLDQNKPPTSGLLQNQANTVSLQENPTEKALYFFFKKKQPFFDPLGFGAREHLSLSSCW